METLKKLPDVPGLFTEPLAAHVGKYTNELLGTIEVLEEGKYLAVRMGLLYSRATPLPKRTLFASYSTYREAER